MNKKFEIRAVPVKREDGSTRWLTHFLIDGIHVSREVFFAEQDKERGIARAELAQPQERTK